MPALKTFSAWPGQSFGYKENSSSVLLPVNSTQCQALKMHHCARSSFVHLRNKMERV